MAVQNGFDAAQANPQVLRRSTFSSFQNAGVDLFTNASTQNPDSYLDLTNLMPAVDEGFKRRWGIKNLVSVPGVFSPVRSYTYNVAQDGSDPTNTTAVDAIIHTDNNNFQMLSVGTSGTGSPSVNNLTASLFSGHAPASLPNNLNLHGIVSRRWFYYSNGLDTPRKVNPSYVTLDTNTNWGIPAPAAYFANGDLDTTAVSTITAIGGTGSGYTSAPTVTISGGGGASAAAIAIVKSGMVVAFSISNPGSGYTSTPNVEISGGGGSGATAVAVYNADGAIAAVLPTGPIVLNEGRTYTYAWKCGVTGHASGIATGIQSSSDSRSYVGNAATVLSPALGVIGNVPTGVVGFDQIQIQINPVLPIDNQVDTCVLLATADGGSLERLYEVKQIPISPFSSAPITWTDTLPDAITAGSLPASVGGLFSIGAVHAKIYDGDGSGFFSATSSSPVLFEQDFNSLMFNSHPTTILSGIDNPNGNQAKPFQNQAITAQGIWSSDVNVTNGTISAGLAPHFNFQMILTGTFTLTAATSVTFTAYADAAYLIGINGASYVSGPQITNGITHTPLNNYPVLAAQNDNNQDWHSTASRPQVINFPSAGTYNFEMCYATANHDEREFALLANNSVILQGSSTPGFSYEGLTLLNANLWVDTDQYGQLFGIPNNDPPPANLLYPTAHQGRIFGTDGANVFFSKSITDVTTSTGLITSKWEEAWPGDNVLPIALDNEVVTGLKSDGTTLHIGTTKAIYSLEGTDPTNFSVPSALFQQTGVLSHDCWSVVFAEGEPAGYMWITPDLKVMWSDFNTYREIGSPIYPILKQWDSSFTSHSSISSFTYGPYSFCMLAFRRAAQPISEYLVYETSLKRWYRWQVAIPGTGPLSSFVYQHPETGFRGFLYADFDGTNVNTRIFDPALTTDLGNAFSWNATTSWQNLGDPLAFKSINELEVLTDEASMQIQIFGARTQADFANPVLKKSGTLVTGPLHTLKLFCAGTPTASRYFAFQFSSTVTGAVSSSPVNVLNAFDVQHFPVARF